MTLASPISPHVPPTPTSLANALPGCRVWGAGRGMHPGVPPTAAPHVPEGRWVPATEAAVVGGRGGAEARRLQGESWKSKRGQGTHGAMCPLSRLFLGLCVLKSLLPADRQWGSTTVGVPWHWGSQA